MSVTITPTTLSVSTSASAGGVITNGSLAVLSATGASGQLTWSIVSGSLPPGMNLGSDGRLSGTPQGRGSALVTVRATDSSSPPLFSDAVVTVTVT
jgi:Putative Ig domain